ncbi:MAG TPA: NAD-dependent epimerase/dehydratase family protein [Longimicrobiales bacterium]|nr:NAD-dependent epimerase/dehydratase family protein [Longimicrobiales bacterium]
MSTSRRHFLQLSAAAGGALSLGALPGAAAAQAGLPMPRVERAGNPKRILILGGTGFIGPYQVRYAVERGHDVTIFNRGNRTPDLPESVTWLRGDRNDDLESLKGKEWDVVIDNPTTLPFWVRDAASLLRDAAEQYIFVSTISVYAANDTPGADETAALAPYGGSDPMAETMETLRATMGLYGPLKALSEQEAEKWFPGRATIVRPGLIVGPGDPTDRFTYWPARVQRGGEILAPPADDPVQVIDARDLSEWIIRLAEDGTTGVFNATGPEPELSVAGMLWGSWAATSGYVDFVHVTPEFLQEQGLRPWGHMPVWIPPVGDTAGFTRRSIARALEQGLTFRPLADTVTDLLAWHATRPEEERGPQLRAGITPEREAEALAAWRARGG